MDNHELSSLEASLMNTLDSILLKKKRLLQLRQKQVTGADPVRPRAQPLPAARPHAQPLPAARPHMPALIQRASVRVPQQQSSQLSTFFSHVLLATTGGLSDQRTPTKTSQMWWSKTRVGLLNGGYEGGCVATGQRELQMEIAGLEYHSQQSFLAINDLRAQQDRIRFSTTWQGRYFNMLGYFLSIYCVYKIVMVQD